MVAVKVMRVPRGLLLQVLLQSRIVGLGGGQIPGLQILG
jgi:hypothetical protein